MSAVLQNVRLEVRKFLLPESNKMYVGGKRTPTAVDLGRLRL